jgi:carbon-monoxide dehydrogenase medium subunit
MRFPNLKRTSRPRSVAEASAILADPARRAVAVSGGISCIFAHQPGVEEIVLLRDLPLSFVRPREGGLEIGPATLISVLLESPAAREYAGGILLSVARKIGSTLNRNLITVGGNLLQPFIWSDLPTVMLALQAKFRLEGKAERTLSAAHLFARAPRELLQPGEILTAILLPPLDVSAGGDGRTAYRKFTLTENDFALLRLAVVLKRQGNSCREIAVAAGGGTVLPQRLSRAEAAVRNRSASAELVTEAAAAAAAEIKLARDIRCSEEYKRDLCRTLVRETLEETLLDRPSVES